MVVLRRLVAVVLAVIAAALAPQLALAAPEPASAYGRLPLHFEENLGQAPAGVRFLARAPGYAVSLQDDRATLILTARGRTGAASRLELVLLGTGPQPRAVGEARLTGRAHIYSGRNPAAWIRDIPMYGRVAYREIYPGIDLVYYGADRRLEYDFVVAPGADPRLIALRLDGAERLTLDASGDLLVASDGVELRIHRPVAYQEVDGRRVHVDAALRVDGDRVGFVLGAWDQTRPLVIDPVVSYATYIGGAVADSAEAVAIDRDGNAYIIGTTGAFTPQDTFVTKLSADGRTILYQTSLVGDTSIAAAAIAVDAAGSAYLAGSVIADESSGSSFPITANALQSRYGGNCGGSSSPGPGDAFVAKLAPDGTLAYASFLGGQCADAATGIAVDGAGNVFVAGYTDEPTSFPTHGAQYATPGRGSRLAFVAKMPADFSSYVYSTLLGGTATAAGASATQTAGALAVDAAGNAYIAGDTNAVDFPTTPGAFRRAPVAAPDMFVTKLAPDGARLLFSTYLGGSGVPNSMALDPAGNVYVGGSAGLSGPFAGGGLRLGGTTNRGFASKVSADGRRLLYLALLGGDQPTSTNALAVDSGGQAYVAGDTFASDFPVIDSPQTCQYTTGVSRTREAYVAKLSTDGSWLHYAACLGGSADESAMGLAVDGAGAAYVVGSTRSFDFPTRNAAIPTRPAGSENSLDGFAAKLGPATAATTPTPTLGVFITSPTGGATLKGTAWVDIWVSGVSGGASTFTLLVGDQTVATQTITGVHATIPWETQWTADGPITLTARVRDAAGNHGTVTRAFTLANGPAPGPVPPPALQPLAVGFNLSPSNGGQTFRDSAEFFGIVQGASGAPVSHTLLIDGRNAVTERGDASPRSAAEVFSYTWNLNAVVNGPHTLTYTVTDGVGRTATATRTVNVNNTPAVAVPLVPAFTSPAEGATVSGQVQIRASVSSAAATPIQMVLTMDGVLLSNSSGTATNLVYTWDTTHVPDGLHVVSLSVRDGAFRTATTSRTFRVANSGAPPLPPGTIRAFITQPGADGATATGITWFTIWIENAAAGWKTYSLDVGGSPVPPITTTSTAPVSIAWDSRTVSDGTETATVTVRDSAGNTGGAQRRLSVQNTGPISVFITQPMEAAAASGTAWFTIWIEKAAAGSKTYTLGVASNVVATMSSPSNGPVSLAWSTTGTPNGTWAVTVTVRDATGATGSAVLNVRVAN